MSTKTSTLTNASTVATTPTSSSTTLSSSATAAASLSTTTIPTINANTLNVVTIKKELPSDEIKEYAEHTMNELLGWYGFDDVERMDLTVKTTRLLQTAAAATATMHHHHHQQQQQQQQQQQHHHQHQQQQQQQQQLQQQLNDKRRSRQRAGALMRLQQHQQQQQQHQDQLSIVKQHQQHQHHHHNNNNNNSNINNNNTISGSSTSTSHSQNHNNNNNNNSSNTNNNNNSRKSVKNCNNFRTKVTTNSGGIGATGCGLGGGGGGGGGGNDSTTSDHDTRSSREDDSKSPQSTLDKNANDEKIDHNNCCWCRRPVAENAPEFLTTSDGPRYCSESCFTQSRRASFKKAKTCDWCKHVRHAVSYVDFQDGASQLQFCSDKCLNQYKMQIFCKETQAHLDMNPHLRDQGLEALENGANLITPDLWLRNCRSRSASPASTLSVSPGPTPISPNGRIGNITPPPLQAPSTVITTSSSVVSGGGGTGGGGVASTHKPQISVAPVSKLMSKPQPQPQPQSTHPPSHAPPPPPSASASASHHQPHHHLHVHHHHTRKKRPLRACVLNDLPANIGAAGAGAAGGGAVATRDAVKMGKAQLLNVGGVGGSTNLRTSPAHMAASKTLPPAPLSQFAGSSVQDLHMSVPPLSPMPTLMEQQQQQQQSQAPPTLSLPPPPPPTHGHAHPHPHVHQHVHQPPPPHPSQFAGVNVHAANLPPATAAAAAAAAAAYFAANGQQSTVSGGAPPPPNGAFMPRPHFMPPNAAAMAGLLPRFLGAGAFGPPGPPPPVPPPSQQSHPPHPTHPAQHHLLHPTAASLSAALLGAPPPVTVMVPYPVIIPLPLPIPVPLPVVDFYRAYLTPDERKRFDEEKRTQSVLPTRTAPAIPTQSPSTPPPSLPLPPSTSPAAAVANVTNDDVGKDVAAAVDDASANVGGAVDKRPEIETDSKVQLADESRLVVDVDEDEEVDDDEKPLDFTKTKDDHHPQRSVDELNNNTNNNTRKSHKDNMKSTIDKATSNEMRTQVDVVAAAISTSPPLHAPTSAVEEHKVLHVVQPVEACMSLANDNSNNDNNHEHIANNSDAKEKLPKFKITRLQTKRTLIQQMTAITTTTVTATTTTTASTTTATTAPSTPQTTTASTSTPTPTKEAECSRPLRKRKRIIDCDFQKIALKEATSDDVTMDEATMCNHNNTNNKTNTSRK